VLAANKKTGSARFGSGFGQMNRSPTIPYDLLGTQSGAFSRMMLSLCWVFLFWTFPAVKLNANSKFFSK
jgi:hypothetical protein